LVGRLAKPLLLWLALVFLLLLVQSVTRLPAGNTWLERSDTLLSACYETEFIENLAAIKGSTGTYKQASKTVYTQ
jgi:hypothetical protein